MPFSSPGDLPDPGVEPGSPALQADSLLSEPPEGGPRHVGVFSRGTTRISGSLSCGAREVLPPLEVRPSSVAPDPAESRGAPPPPQQTRRGLTLRSQLCRDPEVGGSESETERKPEVTPPFDPASARAQRRLQWFPRSSAARWTTWESSTEAGPESPPGVHRAPERGYRVQHVHADLMMRF